MHAKPLSTQARYSAVCKSLNDKVWMQHATRSRTMSSALQRTTRGTETVQQLQISLIHEQQLSKHRTLQDLLVMHKQERGDSGEHRHILKATSSWAQSIHHHLRSTPDNDSKALRVKKHLDATMQDTLG